MITYKSDPGGDLVEIHVEGAIAKADIEAVFAKFQADVARCGKVRVLERIGPITAVEPAALWRDLQFGPPMMHKVSRAAVVTDQTWVGAMTNLAAPSQARRSNDSRCRRWTPPELARGWSERLIGGRRGGSDASRRRPPRRHDRLVAVVAVAAVTAPIIRITRGIAVAIAPVVAVSEHRAGSEAQGQRAAVAVAITAAIAIAAAIAVAAPTIAAGVTAAVTAPAAAEAMAAAVTAAVETAAAMKAAATAVSAAAVPAAVGLSHRRGRGRNGQGAGEGCCRKFKHRSLLMKADGV